MKKTLLFLVLLCAGGFSAAGTSVSIAPFTFAGRVVDYAHVAYDADSSVEIRLKDADGALLAKTTTATSGQTAYNYVLYVPVTTVKTPRYACVGESVTFEFVDPSGTVYTGLVPANDAVVGKSGEVKRLDVVLATDSDGDGVADEYLESVEYWMELAGVEGPYDPTKDYDGDGRTNYEEYLAGTNPCDANDCFSVRQITSEEAADGYVALRVSVADGRTYSVRHTGSLSNPNWQLATFAEDAASEPSESYFTTGKTEKGERIIFVKKDGPQHFYKVDLE